MRRLLPVLPLAASVAVMALPATAHAGLRAGAAQADITPPIGTPMFAYTARSQAVPPSADKAMQVVADPDHHLYAKSFVPSKGIHTRVRARALVLEQDGERYALVQADLGGVPYALTQEVLRRVEGTGITGDRLLLSATHTHSSTGPIWPADNAGYAALGGDLFDPRIFGVTATGIAEAIVAAVDDLQHARAGWGTAELTDASRNRSPEPFSHNHDLPEDADERERASIDPTLTVLRVEGEQGRPLAAWSNFAVHTTSFGDGNLLFSGDNAAYTERIVERRLARGGRRPLNVWTNGAEGDLSPNGGADRIGDERVQWTGNGFQGAHMAGRRVAEGVVQAWHAAGERLTGDLEIGAARSFLAFDGTQADGEPVGPIEALGAGGIGGPDGFCAPFDGFSGPGQGMKFAVVRGAKLVPDVVPVSVWRIGDLGVAAYPAEITRWMGRRLLDAVDQAAGPALDHVALAGLTNAYVSYTATPEEYDTCHYEGSFTLFGRRQGARYRDFSIGLTRALLGEGDAPAGALEPLPLGFGTGPLTPARSTPDAGTIVAQPVAQVDRLGRATFSWKGGDRSLDARRGGTFVALERSAAGGWETVGTDDGFHDITARAGGDVWTETWQFDQNDRPGRYRFRVTGVADRGAGPVPYTVVSEEFRLRRATLRVDRAVVEDGKAKVRALYPDPGPEALLALPRLVLTGHAELRVTAPDGQVTTVRALPDPSSGEFVADVPQGSSIEVLEVVDKHGNATA